MDGTARIIPLTKGMSSLVDAADYDRVVSVGKWHAGLCSPGKYYARHRVTLPGGATFIESLHNFLTGWDYVDHINGDGLDNRRTNLRRATTSENLSNRPRQSNNTSGFKGVSFNRRKGKWVAQIATAGQRRYLGYFEAASEAARAYDAAARELHGEFAHLNFPGVPQ